MSLDFEDTRKRAVVLGAGGQDGCLLVNHLIKLNYAVLGLGRSAALTIENDAYRYVEADLRDASKLTLELLTFRPDVIFHVAAVHGSAGVRYEEIWNDAVSVNTLSVHCVLEFIRFKSPDCRFLYASSAKVFGLTPPGIINERTERKPECLYSISKQASADLIEYYRRAHGVKASIIFLFNHESKLRRASFFIPLIVQGLIRARKGMSATIDVNSLSFYCDWGCADEFMSIAVKISENLIGEDYVIGTGRTIHAREFVEEIFACYDLDYRDFLREKTTAPLNSQYFVDISKLRKDLGVAPDTRIIDLCLKMVEDNTVFRQ